MIGANDQSSDMPSPDIQPGDYLPGGYVFQENYLSKIESETKAFASESPDSGDQIGGIGPSVALDVGVDPMKMAARIVSAPALRKSTLVIVLIIGMILGCAGRCVIEIMLANQHSSSLTFWRFGWIWEILFPAFIGLFPLVRGTWMLACMASSSSHPVEGKLRKMAGPETLFLPWCEYKHPGEAEIRRIPVRAHGFDGWHPWISTEDFMPQMSDGDTMTVYVCPWAHGMDFVDWNKKTQKGLAMRNIVAGLAVCSISACALAGIVSSGALQQYGPSAWWIDLFPFLWFLPYSFIAMWQCSQWDIGWGADWPWEYWRWFFRWNHDEVWMEDGSLDSQSDSSREEAGISVP